VRRRISVDAHMQRCVSSLTHMAMVLKEFQTMRFTEPGMSEADLQAHFEYMCSRWGAQRPAYVPVVASGCVTLIAGSLYALI
jgi:hypothetical protein